MTTRALPVARDLRLSAENAMESIYKNKNKARIHAETLDSLVFAAQRLDLFGMKIQFAQDISRTYWTSYENSRSTDSTVRRNLSFAGITGTNAPLEDMRDATLRVRDMYRDRWLAEAKPYWLSSVTIRFDNSALEFQQKINQVKLLRQGFRDTRTAPTPESLGFYKPIAPPPPPPAANATPAPNSAPPTQTAPPATPPATPPPPK